MQSQLIEKTKHDIGEWKRRKKRPNEALPSFIRQQLEELLKDLSSKQICTALNISKALLLGDKRGKKRPLSPPAPRFMPVSSIITQKPISRSEEHALPSGEEKKVLELDFHGIKLRIFA